MDKEVITRAAHEAVNDLKLDCEVTDVCKPFGKNTWCVQFTGSYGQFCDEFHDKEGKENSARVIREKIKRFFLKQRKPTRIVRGKGPAKSRSRKDGDLISTIMQVGEQAVKQASRITGEVVERASTLNRAVLKAEADLVEGISPTAAEIIRPGGGDSSRIFQAQPPRREALDQEATRQTEKRASRASKSTRKTARGVAVKVAVESARPSKASPGRASKKRAAKTATKRAAKKGGKKASRKKSGAKARRSLKKSSARSR